MPRYFKAQQPDPYIKKSVDMTPARFGHLNHLINMIGAIGGVDAIPASTNLTAPGAFVDAATTHARLVTVVPQIEARLDAIEAKINGIIAANATATGE